MNSKQWDAIETILLDMDGTLLDLAFDNYFWLELVPKAYAKKHGLSHQQADQFLKSLYQEHYGTLDWYCTDFWSKKMDLDIVGLKRQVAEKVEYRSGTIKFLQQAKLQGKKLYLITNAHPDTMAIKLAIKDFSPYFDELLSSHDTGYPKENLRFWQTIQAKWNFDKDATLFVDDSVTILRKADEFGIAQVIGVTHPDSSKPAQSVAPFNEVNELTELLL
ncbi:MAG: GMP/IMP nucleotidase [Gammaproteobacteria bacterium]|nr:GMP/IMP nucleotidase [Gammaproteobacteria bacterium]